jgi:putative tricarboxylic transport membrane protein
MSKRIAEVLLLSGFLILAVLLYRSTASYPEFVQGSTAMYVRFLGGALGVLCVLELVVSFRNKKEKSSDIDKMHIAANPVRFWVLLLLMVAYTAVLSMLGFYRASALFLPLAMVLLGAKNPLIILLTSGGVLLFVYLVFAKLLEVSLPMGTLF